MLRLKPFEDFRNTAGHPVLFGGFYLATIVLMAASLLYLRVPKWQILISTIVIIGLVYGAFTMFLGVKLPVGLLFK